MGLIEPARPASELLLIWELLEISDELARVDGTSGPAGRIELTSFGEVVRRPHLEDREKRIANFLQNEIVDQLGGRVVSGFPMLTPAGIRVPTLTWLTRKQDWPENQSVLQAAPPACVEIMVSAIEGHSMTYRTWGYLQCGVREVIRVNPEGRVTYYRPDGEHADSAIGLKRLGHVTV